MDNDLRYQILLKKFLQNQCTEEELQELISYFQKADSASDLPELEEVLQELDQIPKMSQEADRRMYERIVKAKMENKRQRKRRSTYRSLSMAAVFAGILLLGYFAQDMLLSSGTLAAPAPTQNQITLQLENGAVEIIKEADVNQSIFDSRGNQIGEVSGRQLIYGTTEQPVDSLVYNQVSVPYGKTFELLLADGSAVQLNAGTTFRFPVNFLPGQPREVFLQGEAFFDVTTDQNRPFIVSADQLEVQVLGTQFNVLAYPEDSQSQVVLVEGSVAMAHKQEKQHQVVLTPGDRGVMDKEQKQIAVSEVPTSVYTSWVHGELVFRNLAFDEVLKQLERHFNVQIENDFQITENETINGNFGKEPLENVLEYLKQMYDLEYAIRADKVIIK